MLAGARRRPTVVRRVYDMSRSARLRRDASCASTTHASCASTTRRLLRVYDTCVLRVYDTTRFACLRHDASRASTTHASCATTTRRVLRVYDTTRFACLRHDAGELFDRGHAREDLLETVGPQRLHPLRQGGPLDLVLVRAAGGEAGNRLRHLEQL